VAAPSGYSFKTALTFEQLRERLATLGHGDWQERDSDIYGTYLTGKLWGVRMRIYDGQGMVSELGTYDAGGYMLLDYARSAIDQISDAHDRRIRDELLPALDVTHWKPDERND
jgi:hypothetical protein